MNTNDEPVIDDEIQDLVADESTPEPEVKSEPKAPDIAKELREAAKELVTAAQPKTKEEPPPMSPEELRKQFQVFEPDDNFFMEQFNLPEDVDPKVLTKLKGAFGRMQQGLVKQAVFGARYLMMQDLAKYEERLKGTEEYVSTARARSLREGFHSRYPVFKDKKYNKFIQLCASQLGGKDFEDEDAYFDALAESAATAVKEFDPSFDLGSKPKPPTANTPRLPRTSVGGTGGAGGQGGSSANGGKKPLDGEDYF